MPAKRLPRHCGKAMSRLYIRRGTKKREWIPVGYYCAVCSKMIGEVNRMSNDDLRELLEVRQKLKDKTDTPTAIVIDWESKQTKVGFGGEIKPRLILDTAIYYSDSDEAFIREVDSRDVKKSKNVVWFKKQGESINWNCIETFLEHIFKQLKVKSHELPVLFVDRPNVKSYPKDWHEKIKVWSNEEMLADPSVKKDLSIFYNPELAKAFILRREQKKVDPLEFSNIKNMKILKPPPDEIKMREKLTELLFTKFNVPALFFGLETVLSLYASDRHTGISVIISDFHIHIAPIYIGFALTHAVEWIDLGGESVTLFLTELLKHKGIPLTGSLEEKRAIKIAKEEFCYIALDPTEERSRVTDKQRYERLFELPSGKIVNLKEERFLAPEILFHPEDIIDPSPGLVKGINDSIQKCHVDLRRDLYDNIVLSGSGSMFPGIKERLFKEITGIVPESVEVKIIALPEREDLSWIGGSLVTSWEPFDRFWITKEEYNKKGPIALERHI